MLRIYLIIRLLNNLLIVKEYFNSFIDMYDKIIFKRCIEMLSKYIKFFLLKIKIFFKCQKIKVEEVKIIEEERMKI